MPIANDINVDATECGYWTASRAWATRFTQLYHIPREQVLGHDTILNKCRSPDGSITLHRDATLTFNGPNENTSDGITTIYNIRSKDKLYGYLCIMHARAWLTPINNRPTRSSHFNVTLQLRTSFYLSPRCCSTRVKLEGLQVSHEYSRSETQGPSPKTGDTPLSPTSCNDQFSCWIS